MIPMTVLWGEKINVTQITLKLGNGNMLLKLTLKPYADVTVPLSHRTLRDTISALLIICFVPSCEKICD